MASELVRRLGWSRTHADTLHFRTHGGREVDLVLGVDEGHVIGVEIKAPPPYQSADCLGARERSLHHDSLPLLFHAALGRIRRIDELLAG